ncbi:sulfatase-like hydrolase/transferase [Pontiellaceae bacterium B12227]|nr:sulfatase-like hydrolase/transferase [Pontiellaceae bacterium B12227]
MQRYLKTFYLWLALFSVCNMVSLFVVQMGKPFSLERWVLYPAAWVFQLPLVFVFASVDHGVNGCFSRLSLRFQQPVRFFLCLLGSFIFMGTYAASQTMYQQIETFISLDSFRAVFSNPGQIIPDVRHELGGELVGIGIVAMLFSAIYTWRCHSQKPSHSPAFFAVFCVVFLASGAGGMVVIYNSDSPVATRIRKDVLPTTYLTFSIIDRLLPTTSPTVDFLTALVFEPRISMDEYMAGHEMSNQPDVYLIMLESISWDRYGFMGYEREVSPHIDALAAESIVFPKSYAIANHSSYAQTGTHASMYPLRRTKLDQFEKVNYPKTMLFDVLSYAGYRTAFFSAQNEDWLGMKTFIEANTTMQHFFHSKSVLGNNIGIESKLEDEVVRKHAEDYLSASEAGQPVFMYLNLQATHFPYAIPEGADQPFQPASMDGFSFNYTDYDTAHLDRVINKFDNALRYVDQQVGAFIDHLKSIGRYENSLIVLTSDHGEAFYKHGLPTHGTSLFEDQVRTATLFKLPHGKKSEIRNDPISLIDLNPTVLEILGLPNHPNFQGRQILNAPRKSPIYMMSHSLVKSHGLVDYPWKYFTSDRDGEQLLNLEIDPDESADLSADYPEMLEVMKNNLQLYQLRQLYYYNVLPQRERDQSYPPRH